MLIGAVLTATLGLFVKPVTDADFWLHSRTGRWIVEHRALPAHDLFTYTVPDHRWVNHEYLTEALMWLLRARFGLAGVSVALGVLAWLGLVLVAAACGPRRRPYAIVGAAVALGAAAGAPIWGPRPQMVTFALAALELLWLRRALDSERSRAILWLPAVMALWSNLHGGWPAGFLFLGLALAAEAIAWAADRSPRRAATMRRIAAAGALSAIAVGLNPNGLAIYAYPFQTVASAAQQSLIREWMSPDFHLASLRAFELMALALMAGLALGRPSAFDVLVALAGLALALESVRHIPLFVAAATPVLAMTWSDAWTRLAAPRLPSGGGRPARWGPALGAAILLAVAAAIAPGIAGGLARQPDLTARVVPVGAADWLAAHPATGTRMFNEYAWGGYLADRFSPAPNRRVFVVSEGVLMGDAQLLRYRDVATLRPGWRAVLAQDRVDYVVFDSGSALDGALANEPGWRLAYRDATAVVYVRLP
ncbi:MAG TPA: hypothetical protein VOB72_06825 [Candidatus Dormibacteraeota bacterium]|nr:hypothetical protein [Candidatus Dormibacteraeota bacterium]